MEQASAASSGDSKPHTHPVLFCMLLLETLIAKLKTNKHCHYILTTVAPHAFNCEIYLTECDVTDSLGHNSVLGIIYGNVLAIMNNQRL
jgi:hypothetical protein